MTALAAAAELSSSEGRLSASAASSCRSAGSETNRGFRASAPCGLIMLRDSSDGDARVRGETIVRSRKDALADDVVREQVVDHGAHFLLEAHVVRPQVDFRAGGRLVGIVDAGEVLDL